VHHAVIKSKQPVVLHLLLLLLLLLLCCCCRYPPGAVIRQVNEWLACLTSDAVVVAASGWDMRNLERKGAGGGEGACMAEASAQNEQQGLKRLAQHSPFLH
jgi:hypothetical protein